MNIVILTNSIHNPIKRIVSIVEHLLNPICHFTTVTRYPFLCCPDLVNRFLYSQRIPNLKWPQFPTEACPHGIVYPEKFIRNFGYSMGYIFEQRIMHSAKKRAGFVIPLFINLQPLTNIVFRLGSLQRWFLYLFLLPIFTCLQVEYQNFTVPPFVFYFFIKSLSALLTEPSFIHHLLDKSRQLEYTDSFIRSRIFSQSISDIHQRIQPHHIGRTESGRFWVTHRRTGEFIHLLHRELQLVHQVCKGKHRINPHTIAYKCRRVFTKDRRLSKKLVSVVH